jgi:hypothetical protein
MKIKILLITLVLISGKLLSQEFTSAKLFSIDNKKTLTENKVVQKGTSLTLSPDELNKIFLARPAKLNLQVPFEGKIMTLELERFNPLSNAFQVTVATAGGKTVNYPYEEGLFFRGKIKNDNKSFAGISFFRDEVAGVIADGKSNISIGAVKQNGVAANDYLIYRNIDANLPTTINCSTDNADPVSIQYQKPVQNLNTNAVGCPVDIYVEADFATYTSNGNNISKTVNFVATIMNAVAIVYLNENITLQLREVKVWTVSDPYTGIPDAKAILKEFRNNMAGGFNGDLASFFSTRPMAGGVNGIATVGALCNPDISFRCSVVGTLNSSIPTEDRNTYMVAHELGHNCGSLHTHNCSWVGGALDNCSPPEGTCAPGPAPVNGGTIMSYCSINLANGFGKQPGDKIRSDVTNASCICTCNSMEVTATSSNVICGSNGAATASVTGIPGTVVYLWDNGETTATASALSPGWHYVTVSNQATPTCKIIKAVNVTGTVSAVPNKPLITRNIDDLFSSVPNGNQWFLNGVAIIGATSNSYHPQVAGNYTVQVTTNGCKSSPSDAYFFQLATASLEDEIKVFPNPVSQSFNFTNSYGRKLQVQVFNILGQSLVSFISSNTTISVDIKSYSAGVYTLVVTDAANNETVRRILEKL